MRTRAWFLWAAFLLASQVALADGEPSARFSDTGVIVPVERAEAWVLDQRLTLTIPPPMKPKSTRNRPAIIRAEYVLCRSDESGKGPLRLEVAWPSSGMSFWYNGEGVEAVDPACLPAIKFDGKPVAYNFLTLDDLAQPYVRQWLARIDVLLESKPALKEQVLKARDRIAKAKHTDVRHSAVFELSQWLVQEGLAKAFDARNPNAEDIARGLCGVTSEENYHTSPGWWVQDALHWLDPEYEPIYLHRVLAERWGQDTRLLNPADGMLCDTRYGMLGDSGDFAVFRFPITLQPGKKHRLVVQYGQFLGFDEDSSPAFDGLLYLMEPARRWGRWEQTTIEIRVPTQWKVVGIRPPAKKAATEGGMAIYRMRMGRPCENLYVSVSEGR